MSTPHQEWLAILKFAELKEPQNGVLLSQFFWERFGKSPLEFQEFLESFKKILKQERRVMVKRDLATRYLKILSNLCERFGAFKEKSTLDDYCFEIVDPANAKRIKKLLSRYRKNSSVLIGKIQSILEKLLADEGHRAIIIGRYKSHYSIYRKLFKRGNEEVLSLRDIFAFRILVEDNRVAECFEVASLLHDRFYPVPDAFKDYITIPKINGYQSIHTGLTRVIPDLDLPVEVQIRTEEMHRFAEKGLAAHWKYAQAKKAEFISNKEAHLLDYLGQKNPEEVQEVYFFSHTGDLFKLPNGATLLDFAYCIHTDLGNKLKGAKVNGKVASIQDRIRTGDRIELIKDKKDQVTSTWLKIVNTPYAQRKIQEALKALTTSR